MESAWAVFSDGLAQNATLEELDLRNNQLSHEAIVELSRALKQVPSPSPLRRLFSPPLTAPPPRMYVQGENQVKNPVKIRLVDPGSNGTKGPRSRKYVDRSSWV